MPEQPTAQSRSRLLEEIVQLPALLRVTTGRLTPDQLLVPYRPGGWNTRQVLHHLADSDIFAFIRFKRALTEEAPAAGTYREELWAGLADYGAPPEDSLSLMEALRIRFAALVRSMRPEQFQRVFASPTHGVLTLDIALQRLAWHGRHHHAQIECLIERKSW